MNKEVIQSTSPNDYVIGQLMQKSIDERTPAEREALDLHGRLVYDRQMVEVGIVSMCRDLKAIRDGKHYVTLGFNDFGEYTEQMHGIGARQAYNYIRVYEQLDVEVLNLTSKIGVTKLLELASLDSDECRELLQEHSVEELEDMNVAEVKRLTEQVKKLEEQISMFEANEKLNLNSNSKTPDFDESTIRAELEEQLCKEYDDRIANIKAEAESGEITRLRSELKQAHSDMKANNEAIKKAEALAKAAEERAKTAEEAASKAFEFECKIKAMEDEKAAMEKQIRISSNPELTRFKYMFETWQAATTEMFVQLEKLDVETQQKMIAAIKTVIGERI